MSDDLHNSFLLEGPIDWPEVDAALEGLRLVQDHSSAWLRYRLLDCQDQSLRTSGRVLLDYDGALLLLSDSDAARVQPAAPQGTFPADLPEGPVRALTHKMFPLRCFLIFATGSLQKVALRVVDDETKTQLRMECVTFDGDGTQGRLSLVTLSSLRGYTRAPQRVRAALRGAGATRGSAARIFAALAPEVAPYVSKPQTDFRQAETAFDVAVQTIANYIRVARENEAGVIADLDSEFLHDYRVALRKVRSVLSLFKDVFGIVQTAEMKAAFADLMAPTGRLRDLDVYLMEQDDYFALLPSSLHPGLRLMFETFAAERDSAHAGLAKHLKSRAYHDQITALAAQFDHPGGFVRGEAGAQPAAAYARKLIWKRYRRICKIASGIDETTPDAEVHALRIACKKFRYLVEFFAPLFAGKSAKRVIKRMKVLQDNLGAFNDYSVQQETLLAFVAQSPALRGGRGIEAAQSIGALIAILDQRQRDERARVMENFTRFNSAGTRAHIHAICQAKGAQA